LLRLCSPCAFAVHRGDRRRGASPARQRRDFRFVGPITASALLQAAGIVDDHVAGCSVRDAVKGDRAEAAALCA
jgi:hypothetical protein